MIGSVVDLLLLLIVGLGMLRGWQTGFLGSLLDLGAWIGSLVVALRFYQPVGAWLGARVGWDEVWDRPVAFVVVAILAGMVIGIVGRVLLARLPKRAQQSSVNRLLGVVPGFVSGLISAAIVAALLLSLPLPDNLLRAARDSAWAGRLAASTERFAVVLSPVFNDAIAHTLTSLTIRPDSNETVDLPFATTDATPVPALEAEMLRLINDERAEVGLPPLEPDPQLTEVARQHSADMLARGYFAHTTPEGRTPFDRIDAASIPYLAAGENLALAPTLSLAHTGLMNSPGHRENILRPEFGRVGIGILDAGPRGLMVTQNFRN